jgi:hypothetical protein
MDSEKADAKERDAKKRKADEKEGSKSQQYVIVDDELGDHDPGQTPAAVAKAPKKRKEKGRLTPKNNDLVVIHPGGEEFTAKDGGVVKVKLNRCLMEKLTELEINQLNERGEKLKVGNKMVEFEEGDWRCKLLFGRSKSKGKV